MTAITQALSVALLDFVWQGLLIALLLWTALWLMRGHSPQARYLASCLALAGMALAPVVTACLAYQAPVAAPALAVHLAPVAGVTTVSASFDLSAWLARWALPVWCCGVLLFSLRLAWVSRRISSIRRQAQPAEAFVFVLVSRLCGRMNLKGPARVLISTATDCPSVVGWLRPAVLLPAATMAGLTPQQLEAVLAHELAHILRHDHLVNMLQSVVETLLFYHPAVWWASERIRHERELCCDDVAVAACGDALCYARALTCLERLRSLPSLALGSAGGSLLYRIRRIMGEAASGNAPSKLPGVVALALSLVCLGLNLQRAHGQQTTVDLGSSTVIHREAVEYPDAAIEKGIQGRVLVEVTLDAAGEVTDARVLGGPAELRKAALQSVLDWHFTHDAANSTRQVSIDFRLPAEGEPRVIADGVTGGVGGGVSGGISGGISGGVAQGIRTKKIQLDDLQAKLLAEEAFKAGTLDKQRAELEAQLKAAEAQLLAAEQVYREGHPDVRALKQQLEEFQLKREAQSKLLDQSAAAMAAYQDQMTDARKMQMEALVKRLAEMEAASRATGGPIFTGRKLKSIEILGLSTAVRDDLLDKLPIHVGDKLAEDAMEKVAAAVNQFDEHLNVSMYTTRDGEVEIKITAPGEPAQP